VQFVRLAPNNLYLDLVAAWRAGEPSVVLRTFLDFLDSNADAIRRKADLAFPSSPDNRWVAPGEGSQSR
jgi:hypothetical protein